jgi:agmatinase
LGDNGYPENNAVELKEFFSYRKIPDAISNYEDAEYVIFGVPFDGTSSYRRGSRLAPDAIRYAYRNLESYDVSYGVDYLEIPIADLGDLDES